MLAYLSLSALIPTAAAIGYGESFWPFLAAGGIAGGIGLGLARLGRRSPGPIGFREGYLVVSLTWLLAACYAALPYLFSAEPQLSRPVDALFEGMSGFTTTGASVVTNVEALDRSLLLWRQLSQWLGGLGIIVLALAVLPRLRIGGRQMFESELPGPEVNQLAERIRDTARRLWLLYIALTLVLFGALLVHRPRRARRRDGPVQRARVLPDDAAARRVRTGQPLARAVRPGDAVGRGALHGARRAQLRASLPRPRASRSRRAPSGRGGTALRWDPPRGLRRRVLGARARRISSRARRRCARRSSRRPRC